MIFVYIMRQKYDVLSNIETTTTGKNSSYLNYAV